MKNFNDKLQLKEILNSLPLPQSTSNNRYEAEEIIESFLLSVWLGCYKFSHTHILRLDDTLKEIFGWNQIPSDTTYKRFFQKFNQGVNNEVFPLLQQWFFNQLKFDNYALDLDSTAITRYGNQEGNVIGYNPNKRGRPSHHPLFAFLGNERMVVNSWLRSGNTSSSHQCINFLTETLSILQNKKIGLLRADSGFASDAIFTHLEKEQINYVIAGRMHQGIQDKIKQLNTWTAIGMGIWISEMDYQATKWKSSRRVVVIRQSVDIRPKATGKKLKLFNDQEFYQQQYRYHIFYTNQKLPATQIWEQYKGRGDCENRIKELKYDFALEGFNMKDFFATEAALRFVNLAYNIISLFRQVTSEKPKHHRLQTLRLNCYAVGAWMTKNGNSKVLKMAVPIKKRKWMEGIFAKVEDCSFPLSIKF